MTDVLATFLAALDGKISVSTDPTDLARHCVDYSGLDRGARPLAVTYPRTTEHVSQVLEICHRLRVPVVPQGGLTGMVGGALPVPGSVVLSLQYMHAIEEIDSAGAVMVVQAGVPLQEIQQAAEQCGLIFPLDLGARGSCQIGGNIATNAGGNRVLRYGMARELILGLEVVLADGRILSSLNRMLKNNAGFDLKHLFIGSEGTLGVITRAVLRLFPAPRATVVALCTARDYRQVVALLELARSRLGGSLSAFEVMWKEFYALAVAHRSKAAPLAPGEEFYVLVEGQFSDEHRGTSQFEALFEEAYEQGLVGEVALASSMAQIADLWSLRDFSGELERTFGRAVNFDVSIPVGKIADFVADCRERLRFEIPDARMLVFGHIADCNIHLACRTSAEIPPREDFESVIYRCVGDWRGSISAEHGIGAAKRHYLPLSRTAEEIALMTTLKEVLDPNNTLNPGKVVPDRGSGNTTGGLP